MAGELWCIRCGHLPYEEGRQLQVQLEAERQADQVPDVLLLLEHFPVYTKGRRSRPEELPMGEDWYRMQGIEIADADRGGSVTYHGPGQLVGYPIVSLRPYRDDVHSYVRRLERVMIDAMSDLGVGAGVIEGLTGVWAGEGLPPAGATAADVAPELAAGTLRKIGSIGVHISRGVTTHGFAINVNNDLQPFEWIVPCGIQGCRMTSVCRELGEVQDMNLFMDAVTARFAEIYERTPVARELTELAERPAEGASVT